MRKGVTFRDIAIDFIEVIDLADEKAHQALGRYGGDHRCGNCLGDATQWHLDAYHGTAISLEGVCYIRHCLQNRSSRNQQHSIVVGAHLCIRSAGALFLWMLARSHNFCSLAFHKIHVLIVLIANQVVLQVNRRAHIVAFCSSK